MEEYILKTNQDCQAQAIFERQRNIQNRKMVFFCETEYVEFFALNKQKTEIHTPLQFFGS